MKRIYPNPRISNIILFGVGLLIALVLLALLQGCWLVNGPQPTDNTPNVTPTPTPEPTKTGKAVIYFTVGEKLNVVGKTVDVAASVDKRVFNALVALCEGPTADERARGYGTVIPAGTKVNGVSVADKIATIDLSREFESGGGSLSMLLRVAQVVWTATAVDGIEQVTFKLDGKKVEAIGGEGIIVAPSVGRKDFDEQVAAIVLESPFFGDTVQAPIEIKGNANVFEAQFMVEIKNADGKVLASQPIMATSGTGTRGTFDEEIELPMLYSGVATIVLYEPSAKDGSRTNEIQTQITVQK